MIDLDHAILEAAATRRQRLIRALAFGPIERRRPVRSDLGRFIGSAILAAVIGASCLGTAWVVDMLETDRLAKASAAYDEATKAAPIPDPTDLVDKRTGFPVDPRTGYAVSPKGRWFDRVTGWEVDKATGLLIEPQTGVLVDPETGRAVPRSEG